jgi:hypothetical protein
MDEMSYKVVQVVWRFVDGLEKLADADLKGEVVLPWPWRSVSCLRSLMFVVEGVEGDGTLGYRCRRKTSEM